MEATNKSNTKVERQLQHLNFNSYFKGWFRKDLFAHLKPAYSDSLFFNPANREDFSS